MKRFIEKYIVTLALVFFVCSGANAEDIDLDKIVVTPSRIEEPREGIARSVDVITKNDIERLHSTDLSQVINDIASLNISDYGGSGASKTVRMRGSTASQVLIMIDGRPINSPRDGEADLSTIPLENIERVEVMHGPGSSLYGSGPMGGTINIVTKNPPKENQKTELTSSFGTFRTYEERLSHGGRISKLGYIFTGEILSSSGFRENSAYRAKDFNAKFEYEANEKNTISAAGGFYKSRLGSSGSTVNFDADDKQNDLKNFFDLGWIVKPDDRTTASARVYQNYENLQFLENTAGSIWDTAFNKDVHTTKVRGAGLQASKKLSDIYDAVFGFDYAGNSNDSTTSAKHKYNIRAAYLENKLQLSDALKVDLSARLDDYSNLGTQVNPSFGFVYAFEKWMRFHGLISRSFRAPTFNDLYWPDQGWTKGNPNLAPEKGVTGEIGLNVKAARFIDSSLTYYRSGYSSLINWAEEAGVWQPKNVSSAVIDGIELNNDIKLASGFSAGLSGTFLKAKDNKTHKYLVYQPKFKTGCSLKYVGRGGFTCEFKGQFTDKRYHDSENTIKVKKFYGFGFNVSKEFKKGVTYFISADNIFNRKYQVIKDYPMPGFSLTSGVKAEF